MCGLTGFLRPAGFADADAENVIGRMTETLTHRGPDDDGLWLDGDAGFALGHRRLAIVDLSMAGHQPAVSASGRYVVAFNGEIYNHLLLRKELEKSDPTLRWRGYSDTETLLAAIDHWGIEITLKRSVGMFAIALWDRKDRVLTLARDRIGEKPLYYGWQGETLIFGSEIKALRAHPDFQANIDRNVLARYMRRGFIEAPYSIYQNVFKLLPGTYMRFSASDGQGILRNPETYWSLREAVEGGSAKPFTGSDEEAIDALETRLKEAVALQSVADVPLGAFLSGGIDSTTIVALMQEQNSRPVRTFTIGFHEGIRNEATHAKAIAEYLGTDHTELYVTPRDVMDVIPKLPALYDEPFGDSSAIPTFLVSQLARQQVTVSLSGDGGDELFGGYTRYQRTADIWNMSRHVPDFARDAMAHGFGVFSRLARGSKIGAKASRAKQFLAAQTIEEGYQNIILQRRDAHDLVLGSIDVSLPRLAAKFTKNGDNFQNKMMYADTLSYLPDDILAKIDRAAMGVSLESRVPLLDHRVVEFAWCLPFHMKVRDRESKWLLKQVLQRYLPTSLTDHPKTGFGVPVSEWIRGPLRDWAESLLSEERLKSDGFLNPQLVRKQWLRHVESARAGDETHWQTLVFQAWLEDARKS